LKVKLPFIKDTPLPIYIVLIFAGINYCLLVSLLWKLNFYKNTGEIIIAFFLILILLLYGLETCPPKKPFDILVLLLLTFTLTALPIKNVCDGTEYDLKFSTITKLSWRIPFYSILGLCLLTIVQYKIIDFIPLPHLFINNGDIYSLMNKLVGFIAILQICPFITLIKKIKKVLKSFEEANKDTNIFDYSNELFLFEGVDYGMRLVGPIYFTILICIYIIIIILFCALFSELNKNTHYLILVLLICLLIRVCYQLYKNKKKKTLWTQPEKIKLFKSTNGFIEFVTMGQFIKLVILAFLLFIILFIFLLVMWGIIYLLNVMTVYFNLLGATDNNLNCGFNRLIIEGWFYVNLFKFFYKTIRFGVKKPESNSSKEDIKKFLNLRSYIYKKLYDEKFFQSKPEKATSILKGNIFKFPKPNSEGVKICNINSDNKDCKNFRFTEMIFGKNKKTNSVEDINRRKEETAHLVNIKRKKIDFDKENKDGAKLEKPFDLKISLTRTILATIVTISVTKITGYLNMLLGFIDKYVIKTLIDNKDTTPQVRFLT
jgi:hypothetical protein